MSVSYVQAMQDLLVAADEARPMRDERGRFVKYLAVFLDEKSRSALRSAMPPVHAHESMHHMTVHYNPTQAHGEIIFREVPRGRFVVVVVMQKPTA